MRLVLDTTGVTFQVTKPAEPKMDRQTGRQRVSRDDAKLPEWVLQVLAQDDDGGQLFRVTVAGNEPKVAQGQIVRFERLEANPWLSSDGKVSVAFRARAISPVQATKAA